VSTPIRESSAAPTTISESAMTGQILYRPERAISWPENTDIDMMPSTRGRVR
jgi:hypothetical protein